MFRIDFSTVIKYYQTKVYKLFTRAGNVSTCKALLRLNEIYLAGRNIVKFKEADYGHGMHKLDIFLSMSAHLLHDPG